eukprot:6109625-Alexandrium_andersonii.AAC.1
MHPNATCPIPSTIKVAFACANGLSAFAFHRFHEAFMRYRTHTRTHANAQQHPGHRAHTRTPAR